MAALDPSIPQRVNGHILAPVPPPVAEAPGSTYGETQTVESTTQESFTISDRRELIRQGLQLDALKSGIVDLQILVNESLKSDKYEKRVRDLEDANLTLKTRMATLLWTASALSGLIVTAAELIIRLVFKA